MKINLGKALVVMLGATTLQAELRVAVDGPSEVIAGQDFEYKIRIANPSEEGSTVLMYYIPPNQLECLTADNQDKQQFKVCYQPDLRRVYGEGMNLNDHEDITVGLTMRACDISTEEEDVPSYFIFLVCKENGEDIELYKRLGLKIIGSGVEVI